MINYEINDRGFDYIRRANSKLSPFILFPITTVLILFIFFHVINLDDFILATICSGICIAVALYVYVYWPLFHKAKLINSLITNINIDDDKFSLDTAQTILYKSKHIKGNIQDLKRAQAANEFKEYQEKLVLQYSDNEQACFYLIKDFYDKYPSISSLVN